MKTKIKIYRNETSKPIMHKDVINAYTKGDLYCVLTHTKNIETVYKYPVTSIFRILEITERKDDEE